MLASIAERADPSSILPASSALSSSFRGFGDVAGWGHSFKVFSLLLASLVVPGTGFRNMNLHFPGTFKKKQLLLLYFYVRNLRTFTPNAWREMDSHARRTKNERTRPADLHEIDTWCDTRRWEEEREGDSNDGGLGGMIRKVRGRRKREREGKEEAIKQSAALAPSPDHDKTRPEALEPGESFVHMYFGPNVMYHRDGCGCMTKLP